MTLPVINVPTYELEVPSTKDTLVYRPFLVKEEKILLMAMEEENEAQLNRALKQVVNNCTFQKMKVDKLPLFDLEYIFLRIRAKSVGEVAKLSILCEDDGETYVPIEIDLETINVEFQKDHDTKIEITDEIGIVMSYPTFEYLDLWSNIVLTSINWNIAFMAICDQSRFVFGMTNQTILVIFI